jgi:tRNA (mo5U34)-methyltransferase
MSELGERAAKVIQDNPEWYHSIELAPGVVTPGRAPIEHWNEELRKLQLPDLRGKSVLDIGAYDGFFSFAAERLGASRVVALDDFVWYADMVAAAAEWRNARTTGATLPPLHESVHWRPHELPGKRPFDAVHQLFNSHVEAVVGNFLTLDPSEVGQFDVVLFLGVLYHMEDPLEATRRASAFVAPGGLIIIETAAIDLPAAPDAAFFEFYPTIELNNDPTNWFSPNSKAIEGLTVAAGLREFRLLSGPPPRPARIETPMCVRYRAIASARKPA